MPDFREQLEQELNKLLASRGMEVLIRNSPDTSAGLVLDMDFRLTGELAEKLIAAAEAYSKTPVDLLATIIETVIQDDLFAAVVGD